jgi:hypothetical protein
VLWFLENPVLVDNHLVALLITVWGNTGFKRLKNIFTGSVISRNIFFRSDYNIKI